MLRKSTRFAVSEMSRTSVLSSKGNTNFLLRDRFCRTKLGRCSPLRYVVLLREASSVCVRRILGYQYRFPHIEALFVQLLLMTPLLACWWVHQHNSLCITRVHNTPEYSLQDKNDVPQQQSPPFC